MNIIPTHKGNLRTAADVVRMVRYVYGKNRSKVLAIITNDHYPGRLTGNPRVDASSLIACHPGGRAAVCRNIVMSSSYSPSRQEALTNVEGLKGVVTGFMDRWLPSTPTLSVLHISEGKGRYKGQWRLDAHILPVNHHLKMNKALQFAKDDARAMQRLEDYVPKAILDGFGISSGKGKGEMVRPRGPLIYPYSRNIDSLEIGKLTDQELKNYVEQQHLTTRNRKDGTIISITTISGRKINVANARAIYAHVAGGDRSETASVYSEAQPDASPPFGMASPGLSSTFGMCGSEGGSSDLSSDGQVGGREVGVEDFFQRRSRRVVRSGLGQPRGIMPPASRIGPWPDQPPTLGHNHNARTILTSLRRFNLQRGISDLESITIF